MFRGKHLSEKPKQADAAEWNKAIQNAIDSPERSLRKKTKLEEAEIHKINAQQLLEYGQSRQAIQQFQLAALKIKQSQVVEGKFTSEEAEQKYSVYLRMVRAISESMGSISQEPVELDSSPKHQREGAMIFWPAQLRLGGVPRRSQSLPTPSGASSVDNGSLVAKFF